MDLPMEICPNLPQPLNKPQVQVSHLKILKYIGKGVRPLTPFENFPVSLFIRAQVLKTLKQRFIVYTILIFILF
jgi:hypothetical protein